MYSVQRTFEEEGVVGIPSRVLLRLEQRIKIPERTLDEVIRRHLCETEHEGQTQPQERQEKQPCTLVLRQSTLN